MACIPLPDVALPTLPSPLTLTPPDPGISFDPELCCKLLPFPVATPPISLPPAVINGATLAILTNALSAVQTYLDALPLDCPRE
jgi:hypothetical protein